MKFPQITVTTTDMERLQGLLDSHAKYCDQPSVDFLDSELARAHVVPPAEVPPDVVTMNTCFRYQDRRSGKQRTITLVYPAEADPDAARLSVLAPAGCALLGLSAGETTSCSFPRAHLRSFVVLEILYQPEASGDFHL